MRKKPGMTTIVYDKEDYQGTRPYSTIGMVDVEEGRFLAWHIGTSTVSQKIHFAEIAVGDIIENIVLMKDAEKYIDYDKSNVAVRREENPFELVRPLVEKRLLENLGKIRAIIQLLSNPDYESCFTQNAHLLLTNFCPQGATKLTKDYLELMRDLRECFVKIENMQTLKSIFRREANLTIDSNFKGILYTGIRECFNIEYDSFKGY